MVYYKRSPFLFTYWDKDNKIVIYNYNRYTKAIVSKEIIKILEILSDWKSAKEIFDTLEFDRNSLTKALEHLTRIKVIHKMPLAKEDYDISGQTMWDPVDLALHRQRIIGGRSPMSTRVGKSPSPIKHIKGMSSFTLSKPENIPHHIKRTLLDVLEERKSIRKYSSESLTVDSLSYFLYHCARIKKVFKSKQGEGLLTQRPYPSGGARYPLEIYVSNNKITDIQRGIHYYDPLKHKLILLNKNKTYQKKFNDFLMAVQDPFMNREPDVVFIVTAVFARTMWKYEKLGLSLILSDLGCLYQTMYLVATEMNLAPCPIGKTYETLVRDWLDLNWFEESHVGTFMLGKGINSISKREKHQ